MNTTGTITPGGPPVTVTVANAGDTATLTFSGTTGQRISLNMTNSTIGNFTTVTIKNPTGGNLKSGSGINFFLDAVPLAASGTYSIVIDPSGTLTGNITLTLYDVPSDFAATTAPGVGPVTVTTSVPGQNGLILFNGSTGQRVSLNMTNSTIGNFTTVTMRNPGGGRVTGGYGINFFLDTVTLPADGTYSIAIDPNATLTGHITLTLYDVPTDFTTTIAPGGPSVAVTTTVPGQNGRLTFVGTAGQTAFLSMTNSTIGNFTTVRVKNPTGATIRSGYGINFSLNNISLPADGTYSIEVDPNGTLTGQITLTLRATPGGVVRIIGLANLGEWLTASLDWVQPPADNAAYQWERCDSNGEACSNLDDVAETHVVETDDVGKTIRVKATVSNSLGTTILTSPAVPILDSVQSQAVLFRPYLRFDFAEHWRPLNVPQFLIEIFEDGSGHLLCFDANSQCLQSPPVTNLGPPYHWLDIKGTTGQSSTFYTPDQLCFKQVGGQDCDKGSRSAIYYEPTRDPVLGYLYLDYWFFYRYNEEPIFPDRDHEGDWEGMTVVVDPTGPPNNTGGPVAAYVLYAIHDDNTWSAYLGAPGTTHTTGYVGQGTHATYPGPCAPEYGDYCGPFEASYDGAFPWSRNDDAECSRDCAIRFEDSDGGAWASWDGTSGINTAPGWGGDSPLSPGQQKRFTCAKAGYQLPNCPTPPFAGIPAFRAEQSRPLGVRPSAGPRTAPPIGGPAGAAMVCAAWEGTSSAVTICQPDLLRKAIRNGNISLRIRPNLRIARFRGRITAAPGVTQAIGQPLQAGQTATIGGPLQNDTDLVVRMRDKKRRWVALFKLPRLSKDRTAALTVRHGDQHPIVSIRWPNRQLAAKYFGRDK